VKTCPYGKESWPTKALADAALKDIWSRPRPGGRRMEHHSYQCPDCGHWHLTSQDAGWVARPSQSELWRRQQLALALVAEAGPDVLDQVRRVLGGEMLADGAA
jgi:hypothetical protein